MAEPAGALTHEQYVKATSAALACLIILKQCAVREQKAALAQLNELLNNAAPERGEGAPQP